MERTHDKPCKKLIRSKSGLRIVVADDGHRSPFVIEEPQWTPDKEVSHCTKCNVKFGFTTRKHHCRRCGQIYCAACCDEKLGLPRMCFIDPVRVCHDCTPATINENMFFECHLKTLTDGACFTLSRPSSDCDDKNSLHLKVDDNAYDDDAYIPVLCKLSQDHRFLIFDVANNLNSDVNNSDPKVILDSGLPSNPLRLDSLKGLRVYENMPLTGVTSLDLEFDFTSDVLRLSVPFDGHGYKKSTGWICAMQQAYKLIYDKSNECKNYNEESDAIIGNRDSR